MISRTLGPEFGGSIGTLFFLANLVSSALYIVGCSEGLVENFGPSGIMVGDGPPILPDGRWWRFFYCSMLNVLNLIVCLIGASMFAKTSVVILGTVCVSLGSTIISFIIQTPMEVPIPEGNELVQNSTYHVNGSFTGLLATTLQDNLYPDYGRDYTSNGSPVFFSTVFGVLFSGVTGIMAGANMSGELKDPAKNIPRGTLSAVGFTMVCYMVVSVLTAASCSRFLLQNNFIFMLPINVWPPFITIGILTATFSASLSNLIGSSRVLEALAKDNVYGKLLSFVSAGVYRNNPVVAVFLSWALVQLILLIGSLNTIAQINSVLFLLSYLATNLACLGLELASAPNFRPSFKYFTWYTAFGGLFGTLVMMFIINPLYSFCSIVLCILLILLLHLFSPSRSADWGSISQALIFHQGVECDGACKRWFHPECVRITPAEYRKIADGTQKTWKCERVDCNVNTDDLSLKIDHLNDKFAIIVQKLDKLDKIDGIIAGISEIKTDIQAIKATVDLLEPRVTSNETDIKVIHDEIAKIKQTRENYSGGESEEIVIQEINERLFRKRNIIIFNLKESLSRDTKTKKEHDTLLISKVIDALNIGIHVNGLKIFRLGKPLKDKDRPLKVVFCSVEDTMQFVSGFSKEAISDVDPALSDISISRDRTMKERQYLKKLRDELGRRRMNEESNITIRYLKGSPCITTFEPKN
ncbi:hypothetical protein J6590_064571 [Homalodisca vitripennis]|nr:hypothetical protein J6590_064571 [Homalodisca vitripennis]